MDKTQAYNGWTNWATWNLALWAGNEEASYQETCINRPFTASSAQGLAEEMFTRTAPGPGFLGGNWYGTPDMNRGDWQDIDWQAIADAWNEE